MVTIEPGVRDAKIAGELEFARERGEGTLGPIDLEPAVLAQILGGAGLRHQLFVLCHRVREQRPHDA